MIKEMYSEDAFPEQYEQELPPEVDPNYIAKPQEILNNATQCYESCVSVDGWNQFKDALDFLDQNDPEQRSMRFLILRINDLKRAIDELDYVTMRRFSNPAEVKEEIKESIEKLETMDLRMPYQLSMF